MADLDQISAMIGGLQADVRRMVDWTGGHERADQKRFEDLAAKIDSLESYRDRQAGGWRVVSAISVAAGVVGGIVAKLFSA